MESGRRAGSIKAVLSRILNLHDAEREALKKHDPRELNRLDAGLVKARACESSLLEKFQAHLQSHRCQPPKALR